MSACALWATARSSSIEFEIEFYEREAQDVSACALWALARSSSIEFEIEKKDTSQKKLETFSPFLRKSLLKAGRTANAGFLFLKGF